MDSHPNDHTLSYSWHSHFIIQSHISSFACSQAHIINMILAHMWAMYPSNRGTRENVSSLDLKKKKKKKNQLTIIYISPFTQSGSVRAQIRCDVSPDQSGGTVKSRAGLNWCNRITSYILCVFSVNLAMMIRTQRLLVSRKRSIQSKKSMLSTCENLRGKLHIHAAR